MPVAVWKLLNFVSLWVGTSPFTSLFHAIGSTIGKEARSLYNVALTRASLIGHPM